MKIAIIKTSTGKMVFSTEVNVTGLNYQPLMKEFNTEGWKAAVDDGIVNDADRAKYAFQAVS